MATAQPSRFGELLRRHRAVAGLTQEELAERARLSARAISDIERGLYPSPRRDTVALLAAALALSGDDRAAFEAAARRTPPPPSADPAPDAASGARPGRPPTPNLPVLPTALVRREEEIAAVARLLREGARLLTLTGPAGVGKTRVALRAAADVHGHYADGVVFVALAPIRDPGLVASAIAGALDIQEGGGRTLPEILAATLRDKHILLLLDNVEQVVASAPLLAELLAACPRLAFLATSRAALRLQAERRFDVRPLPTPDPARLPPVEALARVPAVELFTQRAQAVAPDFALTPANAAPVAAICRRLDGLPLAIELAAARVTLLPPPALLARLEGAYGKTSLLAGGARDLPPRHRTLRGALAWSYDLLPPEEQAVFRRLSAFVGGCALEAAEAVCVAPDDPGMDILDALASLIDKSLLRPVDQEGDEPRHRMLETVREYALDCLEESGEAGAVKDRHARYYAALAERAEPELTGPGQAAWLDRLEREHNNLRAALRRARDSGDIQTALRLAAALWRFWYMRGYLSEGREWLEGLLAAPAPATGQVDVDKAARARALNGAGVLAYMQGDYRQAAACYEESLALRRALGDARGVGASLYNLGNLARDQGDLDRAAALIEESLALYHGLGDARLIAGALHSLGEVARYQGDLARASALHEESLGLRRAGGNTQAIAISLDALGGVALAQNGAERAEALYAEGLALREALGDTQGIAHALNNLARARRARGAHRQALALHARSLDLYRRLGNRLGMAWGLEGIAGIAGASGKAPQAARLFGGAAALRDTIEAPLLPSDRAPYDRDVAVIRAALGEVAFTVAWAEGTAAPLERVVAEALRMADEQGEG